jgi:hemerythrin-like domain-containing protein
LLTHKDQDGWVLAHDSIRAELDALKTALEATLARLKGHAPSQWEVASIKKYWKSHFDHVHGHHTNEDDLFVPFLRNRCNIPEKLVADHNVLVQHMEDIQKLVDALSTEDADCVEALAKKWDVYLNDMKEHLAEEEAIGLPLMRAYFEHSDIGEIIQKILGNKNAPKEEIGSFIYCLGEEKMRKEFMPREGIPFFVWWVGGFQNKFRYYRDKVVVHVEALNSGNPPKENSSFWDFFLELLNL